MCSSSQVKSQSCAHSRVWYSVTNGGGQVQLVDANEVWLLAVGAHAALPQPAGWVACQLGVDDGEVTRDQGDLRDMDRAGRTRYE